MDHLDPKSLELTSDDVRLKQAILDSAGDDVPPAGAREQVLSTLKLGPKEDASARRAPTVRSVSILGLALAVGVATTIAVLRMPLAELSSRPAAPAQPSRVEETVAPPPTSPSSTSSSSAEATREVVPTPQAGPTRPIVKSKTTGTPPPEVSDESTLRRELARVTAARNALTGGDTTRTFQLLDEYDAEFPRGTFSVEVSVLRIEALARAGRTDEARQLGSRFLAQYPQGVLARRVATTLGAVAPRELAPAPTSRR